MKKLLLFTLVACVPLLSFAQKRKQKQANQDTDTWRYEIEMIEAGQQGNLIIKVWSYSSKPNIAASQASKNAVHGVIFKGVPAKDRVPARKALVEDFDARTKHADFFKSFFADGGDYRRYVALTNNGAINSGDVKKVSKKEYKVGVIVAVDYNGLRRAMEEKGIVGKLGSGF